MVDVLPNPDDSGKDLGVFNMANALPQTLAPAIGGVLLAIGSATKQNYDLLLWVAGSASVSYRATYARTHERSILVRG